MKEFYFKKIKGKINPSPNKFTLLIKENNIREDQHSFTIVCPDILDYKRTLVFLRQYIFLHLDFDNKKREIYMPKSYILCMKTVKGSL